MRRAGCARSKTSQPEELGGTFDGITPGVLTEGAPMPTKQKRGKPEMLSRNAEIKSSRLSVRIRAIHRQGDAPEIDSQPWLELTGLLTESLNGVRDVVISLYPRERMDVGTARPAACGAIVRARPQLQFVITRPEREFDRLWAMVLGNRLTYGYFYFTKPHYNTGIIVSASFSSELEE
jgi:hypothetical protein